MQGCVSEAANRRFAKKLTKAREAIQFSLNRTEPRQLEDGELDEVASETVTFRHPFRIKGIERQLQAGAYEVVTDEELIEGLSFPASAASPP